MKKWYVIHTKYNNEIMALANLKKYNYDVYCPMISKIVNHARYTKHVKTPLFPKYIFIKLDLSKDSWININYTRGVNKILNDGLSPVPIDKSIIDYFYKLENCEGLIELKQKHQFNVGQKVIVNSSYFKEYLGNIISLNYKQRALVFLELMGKTISISMDNISLFEV